MIPLIPQTNNCRAGAPGQPTLARSGRLSRHRDVVFIVVWATTLLAVLLGYAHHAIFVQLLQHRHRTISLLEARTSVGFPLPSLKGFISGAFQRDVEAAANDQFPFRVPMLTACGGFERSYHHAILDLTGRRISPVTPAASDVLLLRSGDRLLDVPRLLDRRLGAAVRKRASFYNDLAARHANICFFVFPIPEVADSITWKDLYPRAVTERLAGDTYCRMMASNLSPCISLRWIQPNPAPEISDGYYKTDHHWTMAGAYHGYLQVQSVLFNKSPEVGLPLRPLKWFNVEGVRFRGSLARRAIFTALYDDLVDAEFELPAFTLQSGNETYDQRSAKAAYRSGHVPPEMFYDHYAGYFGTIRPTLSYYSATGRRRNLLVIDDSMGIAIEPLLAAHYGTTRFVDHRFLKPPAAQGFDLEELLQGERINDVVFLGLQDWVLGLGRPQE